MGMVDLMFKSDLMIPREMNNTQVYLMLNYITNMAETMLDQRLTDIGHKADAPFAQAGASYSDFFLAKTKKAFDVSGVAKGNDVLPVLEAIYRELLRAKRGGFTLANTNAPRLNTSRVLKRPTTHVTIPKMRHMLTNM